MHDDLVERDFTAAGPNRLWLTDLTEHPTAEGKLYLCAVKDVWSRRIVGYSISDRMPSALAVDALEMAVARRGRDLVTGCVVHADRGSQFRFRPYVAALHRYGLAGSMGRVASSADNAAMERFFALLQKNVLNSRRWATRSELRLAIVTWIERTYHRRRRQLSLGKSTRSSLKPSTSPRTRPEPPHRKCQPNLQQSRPTEQPPTTNSSPTSMTRDNATADNDHPHNADVRTGGDPRDSRWSFPLGGRAILVASGG